MNRTMKKTLVIWLILVLLLPLLSGCGNSNVQPSPTETPTPTETVVPTPESTGESEEEKPASTETDDSAFLEPTVLTDEQANSVNMLNYLAALTREILAKKNSRIFVEQAYNSLINDINPSKVDVLTQSHFNELLDDLHEFEKILTKRDRLKYLFEQNQAQAMRNAIPNPLGLLSAVQSGNLFSLVASVAYMAVDAVTSYNSAMSSAELQFLQDSWALDDDEKETVHSLRKQTFMYMLEVVREYGLPDKLTLSEEKVDSFVDWKEKSYDISSAASKVLFYENNEAEYEGFGQYWLARAKAHYDNKEYANCLESMNRYEALQIGIYRKDYELAKVLPLAIAAAKEVYEKDQYVLEASRYAGMICENTSVKDWALRYFAAQIFIDLYGVSPDQSYINKAFSIILDNVNELKAEQRSLNAKYIAPVELEPITPEKKDKEKTIKEYNEQLKKARETELPPVYEPLRLNCDLLFALMDQFDYSDTDRKKVDQILFDGNKTLFLTKALNDRYSMNHETQETKIEYTGKDITIPASLLSPDVVVFVTVSDKDMKTEQFNDWSIVKVERPGNDVDSFKASFHSKKAESYNFANATKVNIDVYPLGSDTDICYSAVYDVNNSKSFIFFDNISFTENK